MRKLAAFLCFFSSAALADGYQIVTSIAPLQGLVAELTDGRQTPVVLVPPGADPHEFTLRPSQMRALQDADLIVLSGHGMEPWWDAVAGQVDADAIVITLGELEAVAPLALSMRGDVAATDPHMWLSPEILAVWAQELSAELSAADPEGAAIYSANLAGLLAGIQAARAEAEMLLEPVQAVSLVLGHDSIQYFEQSFGLTYGGALSDGHGTEAGAFSISEIAGIDGPACLVIDINEAGDHGHAVLDQAAEVDVDPLGAALLDQPGFSGNMIRSLATGLGGCAP